MAYLLLNVLGMRSLIDKERHIGVSQIVETHLANLSLL